MQGFAKYRFQSREDLDMLLQLRSFMHLLLQLKVGGLIETDCCKNLCRLQSVWAVQSGTKR